MATMPNLGSSPSAASEALGREPSEGASREAARDAARVSKAPLATAALDNTWARRQFPALGRREGGEAVVYFDNPAGTQIPRRVERHMREYFTYSNANTHGEFATSLRTDALIARARDLCAAFLGASSGSEIVLGPNMTTLAYSLSRAIGRVLSPGDEIIVSDLDHDANISPWLALAERGISVQRIPVRREDCTLDLERYAQLLSPRTKLVAVGYASNAVGTINDVARMTELAHAAGAWVWVDAVHYAPHGPIDVQALGVDFLVCSAYKFFGPHLGILWGRADLLEALPADQVRPAPKSGPEKFETGTKNHEGIAGLIGAFGYLAELGGGAGTAALDDPRAVLLRTMTAVRAYEVSLAGLMLDALRSVQGLSIVGLTEPADLARRVPTFAFTLDGMTSPDVSFHLAGRGIFTWAGNHYAQTLMESLGLEERGGVVRVGAVHYNTAGEVARLVEALGAIRA